VLYLYRSPEKNAAHLFTHTDVSSVLDASSAVPDNSDAASARPGSAAHSFERFFDSFPTWCKTSPTERQCTMPMKRDQVVVVQYGTTAK